MSPSSQLQQPRSQLSAPRLGDAPDAPHQGRLQCDLPVEEESLSPVELQSPAPLPDDLFSLSGEGRLIIDSEIQRDYSDVDSEDENQDQKYESVS